jgi:hypothetical protein
MGGSDGVSAAPLLPAADVVGALDWDAFCARYFPGQRRHDLQAASAYEAYKHGRGWRNTGRPRPRLRLVPTDPVHPAIEAASEVAGAQRLLAVVEARQTWEGEGGYTR